MNEKDLLQLKKSIDTAKSKVSELNGQLRFLSEQLETQWSCKTVEEAQRKLTSLESEAGELRRQIEANLVKIESRLALVTKK